MRALHAEGEGSGAIPFERTGDTAVLVLDWISYTARTKWTRAHRFVFAGFDPRAEKRGPAAP